MKPASREALRPGARPDGGLSLGTRFLLIVLAAVALPLALTGVWLVRDAGRAGEDLLQERMGRALNDVSRETSSRWVRVRSRLLDLAEDPRLQDALGGGSDGRVSVGRGLDGSGAGPGAGDVPAPGASLASTYAELRELVHQAIVRGPQGVVARLTWADAAGPDGLGIPVTLEIRGRTTGALLGHLDVRLRADALLSGWAERTARAGGILGVLEEGSNRPLLTAPFDPALFRSDRFVLDGEAWITRRRALSEPGVVLVLASPLEPFTLPFRAAAGRGILLIFAVGIGGFAVATLLTVRTTAPLAELADAAESVARGELETRVQPEGPSEVAQAARAFNAMAASLQETLDTLAEREALAAMGELAASLAHELRNPLTALRLDLQRIEEVSDDGERRAALTDRMLAAARQLDRTAEGVLRVAGTGRAPSGSVSVDDVLTRAAGTARPILETSDVELEIRSHDATPAVEGDGPALELLFANLLVNAAEAMDRGGRVEVDVGPDEGGVEVVVRDTGPGFPAEAMARALEPLFSTRPGGTGLGLAIADRIVRAHGGRIELDNHPGGGARVVVWLPGGPPSA